MAPAEWLDVTQFNALGDGATDDSSAIQAVINSASAQGGAVVYLPAATYALGRALTPMTGVTLLGDPGTTLIALVDTAIIYGSTVACADFSIVGITFLGPVNETPAVPQRSRTTSGSGAQTAVFLSGDLDLSGSGQAQITNFVMRDCRVRNMTALPIRIGGVRGRVSVTNCEFTNNQDVGFLYDEEVIFANIHIQDSADNGVSVSRGCAKVTVTGNTIQNSCYNGIWVSGYDTSTGPTQFSVTGNTVVGVGNNGIYADAAPTVGSITGNTVDCGYYRGPAGQASTATGAGIWIGGYPVTNRTTPTAYATGISVTGNTIRSAPLAGIYLTGAEHVTITGNTLLDIGTQYAADGITPIAATDTTQNIGILIDQPTTVTDVTVALNTIADTRPTPYCNYALVPSSTAGVAAYLNTGTGLRQTQVLPDTGPARTWQAAQTYLGHQVAAGTPVTVTAGAQSATATAGSNGAFDGAGVINTVAVSAPAAGTIATVTYATPYATTPKVGLTARSAATVTAGTYTTAESVNGFSIATAAAPAAGAALSVSYQVKG
ncbi:glycosyl hydrolase family 28-related protein [Kitasatospora sp. NBC_01302]|uniref:glycosyl hydrolase family 28-related protein n=1 Tax=Kitasatospora sp. NBC_01302 TaxID=2903575 RepID=UPI002E1062C3|nr:right-handed parallel beta-helix repeat-containing protein [Kitasatospora sp. NBC_01302]